MSELCEICHEYHERLDGRLGHLEEQHETIRRDLEVHIAEAHAHLVGASIIQQWDEEILSSVAKLADAVMGPQHSDFDNHLVRDEQQGLIAKVDANTAVLLELRANQLRNGDRVKIQFGPKEWSGIIVAFLSLLGTIIISM